MRRLRAALRARNDYEFFLAAGLSAAEIMKRGGNFDQGGALDWEFFILKLTADGVPTILDRGANPSDSVPDGGVDHGYGDSTAGGVRCASRLERDR